MSSQTVLVFTGKANNKLCFSAYEAEYVGIAIAL
jgi:hypothetical protein